MHFLLRAMHYGIISIDSKNRQDNLLVGQLLIKGIIEVVCSMMSKSRAPMINSQRLHRAKFIKSINEFI